MYGDKSQPVKLSIIGPKGQEIPNAKINISYFITEEQFRHLYFEERNNYREIAELVGFPYDLSVLSRSLRSLGWKDKGKVRQKSDSKFFENKNEASAWILGWVLSDGHVNDKYLGFRLNNKDRDVLLKFKKELGCNAELYEYGNSSELRVHNKEIVSSLRLLGIESNKTFNCPLPSVESEFTRDLIRGVFEGDGWVTVGKTNIAVGLCGASYDLMSSVSRILLSEGIDHKLHKPAENTYRIDAKGTLHCLKWLNYMYSKVDTDLVLDRKHSKYIEYLNYYNNRQKYINKDIKEYVQFAISEI